MGVHPGADFASWASPEEPTLLGSEEQLLSELEENGSEATETQEAAVSA